LIHSFALHALHALLVRAHTQCVLWNGFDLSSGILLEPTHPEGIDAVPGPFRLSIVGFGQLQDLRLLGHIDYLDVDLLLEGVDQVVLDLHDAFVLQLFGSLALGLHLAVVDPISLLERLLEGGLGVFLLNGIDQFLLEGAFKVQLLFLF